MDDESKREHREYEDSVRRIARELWPSAEFSGARITDGVHETDGVFETEECIHIVEATTSRRKQKALQDIDKIQRVMQRYENDHRHRPVQGWFVTREEPTAEQRSVATHASGVHALSFLQFQSRLIDSNGYLTARDHYRFGSVRDPATGDQEPNVKYVPLDLKVETSTEVISDQRLLSMIDEGRRVVLLGDYGAGKSMTLREVYRDLRKRHLRGQTKMFPVYLNLRDHQGQRDPAEVLHRHANAIGFESPAHLVRAWRAGYVHLLIDGFDEVSAINIQGLWRRLRDSRYRAMEVVRGLVRDHPTGAGLMLTGRAHFFDHPSEREEALGISRDFIVLSLNEFTESQIETYLESSGFRGSVPSWLPSRPLLIGYLAAKGSLHALVEEGATGSPVGPAHGWDLLLNQIASREAEIESGIDGPTVRKILERLATKARALEGGLGPLGADAVLQAFADVCGYPPDEQGMVLLQRLPGLGVDREEENSRKFVDEAFADACRAGDLVEFVESPFDYDFSVIGDVGCGIGELGIEVTSLRQFSEGKVNAALKAALRGDLKYTATDLVKLQLECGHRIREDCRVDGVTIPDLELGTTGADLSRLSFVDCFFSRVEIDVSADDAKMPAFRECYIGELDGRVSAADLPSGKFDDRCVVDSYTETAETTAKVLTLDLPLGTRVCLTILKKLFERSGSGRRENALHRGLDHHARRLVPAVLHVLQSEGVAAPDKSRGITIWRPDRGSRRRVGRLVAAPTTENDAILQQCGRL